MTDGDRSVIAGIGPAGAAAGAALGELGDEGPLVLDGEEPFPPYDRSPLARAAPTEIAPSRPKRSKTEEREHGAQQAGSGDRDRWANGSHHDVTAGDCRRSIIRFHWAPFCMDRPTQASADAPPRRGPLIRAGRLGASGTPSNLEPSPP